MDLEESGGVTKVVSWYSAVRRIDRSMIARYLIREMLGGGCVLKSEQTLSYGSLYGVISGRKVDDGIEWALWKRSPRFGEAVVRSPEKVHARWIVALVNYFTCGFESFLAIVLKGIET